MKLLRLISVSYPYTGCLVLGIGALRGFGRLVVLLVAGIGPVAVCVGQISSSSAASSTTTTVTRTLRGQVSNALTGAAVPRTLVSINTRATMTDSQGNFEFREFTDTQANVRLQKPGFSQTKEYTAAGGNQKIADLDAFLDLKLYPDAVVTGVVTGRDGQPLPHVPVALRRQTFQNTGLRWMAVKTVQTDLQGEYRFLEPGGNFQVSIGYVPVIRDTGEVLLPSIYPQATGSDSSDHFQVEAGQERHIDLNPRTSMPYPVVVHIDNVEAQRGGGVQFSAMTSSGDSIPNVMNRALGQGDFQLTLPTGTFTLRAQINNRDTELEGSGRVTVTGTKTEPTVIHIEAAASLPVELAVDPASAANIPSMATSSTQAFQTPDPRQFNLRLHNLSGGNAIQPDIVLRQREDKTYEFRVPPGRYKLDSQGGGGSWYMESATYGMANLATSEIVVGSGGGGIPIRIIVNNEYGSVSGTVSIPSTLAMAWIYLIPTTPSLVPINPMIMTSGSAGQTTVNFTQRLAAGSYVAVALDRQVQEDLHNPDVISHLSTAAKAFTVSGSATAALDLTVSEQKEDTP